LDSWFTTISANPSPPVLPVKKVDVAMAPPDEALEIETRFEPTVAMSVALIDACSCVLETKVVDRALPFH
jgi:hypothetical protein